MHPCAQRTLRRVCQRCGDRLSKQEDEPRRQTESFGSNTVLGTILSFLAACRMMARELPILRIATMTITLKPETERLINEELKSGHYKDAEEVMQRARQTLHAIHHATPGKVQECQDAAARIRALRQGVTLGGLKIKNLIHAGHKYCWRHS